MWVILLIAILVLLPFDSYGARVKDIAYISGVRPNQLVGYGLVVGLNGTGDKTTNTLFMAQSLGNMLDKMGIKMDPKANKVENVAAVIVTAELPPFTKRGSKIDVTVSSIGDAKSLGGGVLVLTSLRGADGDVYAVAQGPLVVGGYLAGGEAATVKKNHPTVGRVPNGATIEKEVATTFFRGGNVVISLKNPDFTNARKTVETINNRYSNIAEAKDSSTISITVPDEFSMEPVRFISAIENLEITPDTYAKVVVDEKTGTVVIGENVTISTVAVSHGNISILVRETPEVYQPLPLGRGETTVVPRTDVKVGEEKGRLFLLEGGVTIREFISALNALGVSSRDMISILQTIKASGALHAELEVL